MSIKRLTIIKIKVENLESSGNLIILNKIIQCREITTIFLVIICLLMKFEYLNLRNIII